MGKPRRLVRANRRSIIHFALQKRKTELPLTGPGWSVKKTVP